MSEIKQKAQALNGAIATEDISRKSESEEYDTAYIQKN